MMKKKVICAALSMTMILSMFSACGKNVASSEDITLVEPVGVTENYATVEYRDLVNYEVFSGKVVPKTYEFNFASGQNFQKYGSLPGTAVKVGDPIAIASTENIDEQIKLKKEQIKDTEISYEETMEDLNDGLAKEKGDIDNLQQIVSNFENMTEEEKKNYKNYDSEYRKYLGYFQSTVAGIEKYEHQIKSQTDMFNLDIDFYKKELNRLNIKRNDVLATAPVDGTVVAVRYFENGEYVNKDTVVGAVGDFNNLRVKTEFIYKNDIKRAVEYYAFANGKRYEATFLEDETEVGASPTESFSAFKISDPNNEIKVGDFVVIVLVKAEKKNVLCVPTEAINTDADGSYVYLYSEDGTARMTVSTGLRSGFYTEITAGLSEGDKIVSEFKVDQRTKTEKVTKGSISSDYSETGYMFYSQAEIIKNKVQYGTTYIKELKVKRNERVTKGQELASIYVIPDDISIRRKERTLLRATEDLNEMLKDDNSNKRTIKHQREYIDDLNKEISEMKADSTSTSIVSPVDGIVTWIGQFEEGDILLPDTYVCAVSDEANCFITVDDASGLLTYGNITTIEYDDGDGKKATSEGMVVNVAPCALSSKLKPGFSLIRVSSDDLAKMASANRGYDGYWARSSFKVTAKLRTVDNVVLIPKRAVKVDNGVTYAVVLDENNKPAYKSFIAGGSDVTYYWVVDGLDEGTTICLE